MFTKLMILATIMFALFTNVTHAATIGTLSHVFLDTESDVIVGMMSVNDTDIGFSFLHDSTIPVNGTATVLDITSDTIVFSQGNSTYNAARVNNLRYNAVLSDMRHELYEDGSECNIFTMSVTETHESFQVCLDPTDIPNARNGAVKVSFVRPSINPVWYGTIYQNGYSYLFQRIQPRYTTYIPIVAR